MKKQVSIIREMSFLIHNTWIWKTNIPDVFLNFISENSHSVTSTGQVKAQVRNNKLKMICIGPDLVFIFSKINELTPNGGPTKNCRKETRSRKERERKKGKNRYALCPYIFIVNWQETPCKPTVYPECKPSTTGSQPSIQPLPYLSQFPQRENWKIWRWTSRRGKFQTTFFPIQIFSNGTLDALPSLSYSLGWLDRNDVPWSSASSSREIEIGGREAREPSPIDVARRATSPPSPASDKRKCSGPEATYAG